MRNNKITRKEVEEAISNPVKIKGLILKEEFYKALREKIGEDRMKIVEKEAKSLGLSFSPAEIKNFEWYPAGILIGIFFILQEKFNFQEKDFAEIAETAPKISPTIRLLMKYFAIPEKIAQIAGPRLWKRFFNQGEVEFCKFKDSKTRGSLTVRIKDFKLHPLHFFYLGHFFLGMTRLVKKFKKVEVKETKSPFRGDEYQEYLIKWKH